MQNTDPTNEIKWKTKNTTPLEQFRYRINRGKFDTSNTYT